MTYTVPVLLERCTIIFFARYLSQIYALYSIKTDILVQTLPENFLPRRYSEKQFTHLINEHLWVPTHTIYTKNQHRTNWYMKLWGHPRIFYKDYCNVYLNILCSIDIRCLEEIEPKILRIKRRIFSNKIDSIKQLQIGGNKTGMFWNTSKHTWSNFFTFMKRKCIIWTANLSEYSVRPTLTLNSPTNKQ